MMRCLALVALLAPAACGNAGREFPAPFTEMVTFTGTMMGEGFGATRFAFPLDDDAGDELVITSPTFDHGGLNMAGRHTIFSFRDRTPRVVQTIEFPTVALRLAGGRPSSGDVDGNGIADYLAPVDNATGPDGVYVMPIVNGLVDTSAPVFVDVAFGGPTLAPGDIDGDGYDDLFASGDASLNALYVGSSNGLGESPVWSNTVGGGPFSVGAGDLDDDGILDIAIGRRNRNLAGALDVGSVQLWFGTQTTTPIELEFFGAANDLFGDRVEVGDVTGDGVDDLVVGARGVRTVQVYRGPLSRTEPPSPLLTLQDASAEYGTHIALVDSDGNGVRDVVVGVPRFSDAGFAEEGAVYVYRGGDGTVDPTPLQLHPIDVVDARFGVKLAVSDLDGDGVEDLVVGSGETMYAMFGECGGDGRCHEKSRYLACATGSGSGWLVTVVVLVLVVPARRRRVLDNVAPS